MTGAQPPLGPVEIRDWLLPEEKAAYIRVGAPVFAVTGLVMAAFGFIPLAYGLAYVSIAGTVLFEFERRRRRRGEESERTKMLWKLAAFGLLANAAVGVALLLLFQEARL